MSARTCTHLQDGFFVERAATKARIWGSVLNDRKQIFSLALCVAALVAESSSATGSVLPPIVARKDGASIYDGQSHPDFILTQSSPISGGQLAHASHSSHASHREVVPDNRTAG